MRPVVFAFASRARIFASMLGLLARKALLGPRLDLRLGRGNAGQALLAPGQLFRHRHPVRHIRLIGGLRQRHQLRDLGLQLRFELARMLIGQRAVPAGVGVNLGAVQRHRAQLEQPGLPRQHQDLRRTAPRSPRETGAGTWRWCRGRDDRWRR